MEVTQVPLHSFAENEKTAHISTGEILENQEVEPSVYLPDLFISFCSRAPKLNAYYAEVKADSDDWFAKLCDMRSKKELSKLHKADFALFAAWWTGDADKSEFRTICDWCNWVFYFDDQFDEGHLCEDKEKAQREADILTQIMTVGLRDDEYLDDPPRARALRVAFRSVWERLSQRASVGVQRRFREAMQAFCKGLVGQVGVRVAVSTRELDPYLAFRRQSIGVVPCIVLAEYFHNLCLPDEFFQHPSVTTIMDLAAEITVLHNDVLSYHKEFEMGAIHNIVIIFRERGLTQQEAYGEVDKLIQKRLRDWHLAMHQLPFYGEELDIQVQKFIQACQEVAVGNLHWSFATERYFGKENNVIRRTRQVKQIHLDA
ncbi:pentalenene synthase [Aspergillus carlsbadensis]|nr:pentalenene synthase [Aspergillus carlsbadensis]